MADVRFTQDILTRSFSSVSGAIPIDPPFMAMDGAMPYAGYLFGTGYAPFAPQLEGNALGFRYDWSQNNRTLLLGGGLTIGQWGTVAAVSTDVPTTPFLLNNVVASVAEGLTIFVWALSASNAKSLNLVRTTGTDPLYQMALLPSTQIARISFTQSTTDTASISSVLSEITGYTMYAASVNSTEINMYAKTAGGSLKTATTPMTKTLSVANPFSFLWETGSGVGTNTVFGAAIYQGTKTSAQVEEQGVRFAEFHDAIGSGLIF